jgi:type VI secretion system secreted protein VgrG
MSFSFDASMDLAVPKPSAERSGPPYELLVFPFPRAYFWVHELHGEEALSSLYHFDVVVSTEAVLDGILERAMVGQRATLIFHAGRVPRVIRGIVAAVTVVQRHPVHHRTQYRIRIVPRMWLLQFRRQTRLFQHQRVDQIVTTVLGGANIRTRCLLTRSHPQRVYCTQYEETDYEFVVRLLAEAGIFFHFASPAAAALAVLDSLGPAPGGPIGDALSLAASLALDALFGSETLVLSDDVVGYGRIDDGSVIDDVAQMVGAPTALGVDLGAVDLKIGLAAPTIHYLAVEGTSTEAHDKVTRFEARRQVRTASATYREYDPARPDAVLMRSEPTGGGKLASMLDGAVSAGVSVGPDGVSASASADIAGTLLVAALQSLNDIPDLEHYEHHGPFLFPDWKYGGDEPARILRQRARDRHEAEGHSLVPVLHAGHRFKLEDHPLDHLNLEYVVTRVVHRGRGTTQDTNAIYENDFECVPARVVFCPDRPPRRSVMVVLTATVVGPPGEDIYTDEIGQIKVQFHWDREGVRNEHSSCWIRTLQGWAGSGWGTQFIPRVGMEVVIAFEGGDPDKPICLGCLNNGTHHPPFILPADRTRSGFRTESTPGRQGHNELSFEDKAQHEQIYLHAERDLDEVVGRNHSLTVSGDECIRIDGNRVDHVEMNAVKHVGGNVATTILGDAQRIVEGNSLDTVTGDRDGRVSGTSTSRVDGKEVRDVKRDSSHHFAEDLTLRVAGNKTVVVGRPGAHRSYALHVEGAVRIHGATSVELSSPSEIVFRCGKSLLRLGAGAIELQAPALTLCGDAARLALGEGGLQLSTKTARAQIGDDNVVIGTESGALVTMGAEVKIDGKKILLNAPDRASDPPPKASAPPTTISLTDQDGNPLANQRFLVTAEDGSEHVGVTDKDGNAELDLPADGEISFPDLSDVTST